RLADVVRRRQDHDAAAAHALADAVVRLADELELDACAEKRAEALPRRSLEAGADAAGRRRAAVATRDLDAQACADRTVTVRDRITQLDDPRLVESGSGIRCEALANLATVGAQLRLAGECAARETKERRGVERRGTTHYGF